MPKFDLKNVKGKRRGEKWKSVDVVVNDRGWTTARRIDHC